MSDTFTVLQISELIVSAFRRPGGHIASPRDVSAALQFHVRFPGVSISDWNYLLVRCHCLALGESIEDRRKLLGLTHRTFQDGWRRAAQAIADGYARESVNKTSTLQREFSARRTAAKREKIGC